MGRKKITKNAESRRLICPHCHSLAWMDARIEDKNRIQLVNCSVCRTDFHAVVIVKEYISHINTTTKKF